MSRRTSKCKDCSKVVSEKDKGIQCEICDEWRHTKCAGLPDDLYKHLESMECLHWYCSDCNKGVSHLQHSVKIVQEKQETMELKLSGVLSSIAELEDGLSKANVKIDEMKSGLADGKVSVGWETRFDGKMEDKMKTVKEDVSEQMEIERRKANVILHGVKEDNRNKQVESMDKVLNLVDSKSDDHILVEEIFKEGLHLDATRHIVEVQRIGRYVDGRSRPIRVKLLSSEARFEILKRAKDLKDHDKFGKVFLSPDLTRKQQVVEKDLRDNYKRLRGEGHSNLKIRSGKIVKLEQGNKMTVVYQPALIAA